MPFYPTAKVRALAVDPGARRITTTARSTAREELGMSVEQVFAAIAHLDERDFYKSMASEHNPGLVQDVYRPLVCCPAFPAGVRVYCKVQLVDATTILVVISYKELGLAHGQQRA